MGSQIMAPKPPADRFTAAVARAIKLEQARGADVQTQAQAAIETMNRIVTDELSQQMRELEARTLYGGTECHIQKSSRSSPAKTDGRHSIPRQPLGSFTSAD
jgi:hypothetical protein